MEAKELMLGDWVNINGDRPLYSVVTSLNQGEVGVCNYLFSADVLLPIPITPEILEKNGFELNDEDDWFEYENNHRYVVVLFCRELDTDEIQNGSFTIFNGCDCRYVHQLQHALRLCGLNELADGFKV